jgi:hypothetical protein
MRHQLKLGVAIFPIMLALAACASSREGRSSRDCSLAAADSAFIGSAPLYRDCAVDRPAEPISTRLDFNPTTPPRPGVTCYSAEVRFVVGADGRPEDGTIQLVRGAADPFAQAVLASIPGWVYSPALLDGRPVRQLVRERRTAATVVTVVPASEAGSARPRRPPPCR